MSSKSLTLEQAVANFKEGLDHGYFSSGSQFESLKLDVADAYLRSIGLPVWGTEEWHIERICSRPAARCCDVRSVKPHKSGFVYLIENKRNGLHKIGFSRFPSVREKTLQAEEPELAMVKCWPANPSHEKMVHAQFKDKRMRGEWFRLSKEDLKTLDSQMGRAE